MKQFKWLAGASIICLALIITTTNAIQESAAASLNEVMVEIGQTIESVFPILFDNDEIDQPSSQARLKAATKKLDALFNEAKPHFDVKSTTYRISYDVIDAQLTDAMIAAKYNNYKHVRNIFKEFITICSSCHTQDPKLRSLFSDTGRSHFNSDLQFANFNYMTRNYDTSLTYYMKNLNSTSDISEIELMTVMKRILTINTQIYNSPGEALNQLAKLKNYAKHTKLSSKNLNEWLAGLEELNNNKLYKNNNPDMEQLEIYVKNILGPLHEPGSAEFPSKKEKVARVWLRGRLYNYLNSLPPKEEIPKILFWLAIIDRTTNYSFYYSLADMYLKECMLQYTSNLYAKKCFEEYEEYITFSYSGSRGTDIPDDVAQELKALKVRVFSAPKQ